MKRSLTFLLLIVAVVASATTVIAPRFETLVDRAELIFTGQMLSQRSDWREVNGQRSIVTLVTFGVDRVHKGNADRTVTLQFLGGTIGDVTLDVAEMPRFKTGERVVLFVAHNGSAVSPVLGFFHGKFTLRKTSRGVEEVLRHDGQALEGIAEAGRAKAAAPAANARAMTHDEFAAKIRERVALGPK